MIFLEGQNEIGPRISSRPDLQNCMSSTSIETLNIVSEMRGRVSDEHFPPQIWFSQS